MKTKLSPRTGAFPALVPFVFVALGAQASPVVYDLSATHYVDAGVAFQPDGTTINTEVGFGKQNFASPNLPVALTKYTANIPAGLVGATFSLCADNGIDCVFGDIVGLAGGAPLGNFGNSTSTSIITGGSGVYAGASGSWSNSAYITGSGSDYSLYNFTDGSLTLGATTHTINGGGFTDGIVTPASFNETGYKEARLTSTPLPVALDKYTATLLTNPADLPPLSTANGTFEWCSTSGTDCLFGTINSFEDLGPRGLWNHVRSVSTVTGGSGAYATASGSWTNDTYSVNYFSGGTRYGLFSLADGAISIGEVPLPGTLGLLMLGGAALLRQRRRI